MALDLKILIEGDPKKFLEAIDEVQEKSKDLNNVLGTVGTQAGIAFAAFSGAILGSVVAFRESEKTIAQLESTLQSTGFAAGLTAGDVQKMALSFQDLTTFGDEAIIAGQSVLLKFRSIGKEAFEPATKAMLDMAQAMGGDVPGSAQLLGKALENPTQGITLLTKQGVQFTEEQKKMIKAFDETGNAAEAQAIILKQVGVAFGGSAAAAAGGLGVYTQLKEVLGDIVEGIGKQFAPTFTSVGKVLLDFAKKIRDNEALLNAIARILAAGAGMAGFITAVTLGTLAVSKIVAAVNIMTVAFTLSRTAVALFAGAATLGIGLIIAFLPEIIAFVKDMVTAFEVAKTKIITLFQNLGQNLLNIGSKIGEFLKNLFTFNFAEIKASAGALKDAVTKALDQTFKDAIDVKQTVNTKFQADASAAAKQLEEQKTTDAERAKQGEIARAQELEAEKKAGDEKLAEKKRQSAIELQEEAVKREILMAEKAGEKDEVIKIKEEELSLLQGLKEADGQLDREIAQQRLDEFRASEDERIATVLEKLEAERLEKQNAKILAREEEKALQAEFDALDEEDRILAQETDLANLNEHEIARREALRANAEEQVKLKQKANQQRLNDEIKYGQTYAAINAAINSSAVQGTAQATSQLTQLQQSRNSTLAGIGKAAAITQIGIDTAKAAMSIYSGFATIPIVGPALGTAGAIAAVAFGAEKISKVRSAQEGGIVPGTGSGDIVPAMLEPGEIVVPRALAPTFQEEFAGLSPDANAPSRRSEIKIGSIIGTEEFVKGSLIPAIRDAVQLDNGNLGVG
jgi:hypothetical protein